MSSNGFLGIDAGTQGLSATFTDEAMQVIATGEGEYEMISGLPDGDYQQHPTDWINALQSAMADLRKKMAGIDPDWNVLAIGISGQMHGEVLADDAGTPLGAARLWCNAGNEEEGDELTALLGVKMPKRITASRWLWTLRNQPEKAAQTAQITTPGGWISYQLTGERTLGIGDASGIFPIDQHTLTYDAKRLDLFQQRAPEGLPALSDLLPRVCRAGEDGGTLTANGAQLTGLKEGIPVAPAEGDQPAAMAGSLAGEAGMIAVSLGTSVCANAVGDRPFSGVHAAIDHFCAADGKPINMVWLRNGTTYMNTLIDLFAAVSGGSRKDGFATVIPQLIEAPADCGGLLALPFMDDEPGLGIARGGTALLCGLNAENATPGNVAKAALLATLFDLRYGLAELDRQGYPRTQMGVSGGLIRDAELGQIVADAFNTPVTILDSATEGSAWGAALLCKYRWLHAGGETRPWNEFLQQHAPATVTRLEPVAEEAKVYDRMYARYLKLLAAQPGLDQAMNA